jgi:branched-chain amino acid transport system permease protein
MQDVVVVPNEVAAELAGVDVTRHRVQAGMIGSAMLGLAGALWAHSEGFIGPSTYAFGHVDIRVIVMLSFGGVGTLLGPVLGAVVFTVLDEWLVEYNEIQVMLYGIVIVVLFLGFRRGVIPSLQDVLSKTWVRPRTRSRTAARGGRASGADQDPSSR